MFFALFIYIYYIYLCVCAYMRYVCFYVATGQSSFAFLASWTLAWKVWPSDKPWGIVTMNLTRYVLSRLNPRLGVEPYSDTEFMRPPIHSCKIIPQNRTQKWPLSSFNPVKFQFRVACEPHHLKLGNPQPSPPASRTLHLKRFASLRPRIFAKVRAKSFLWRLLNEKKAENQLDLSNPNKGSHQNKRSHWYIPSRERVHIPRGEVGKIIDSTVPWDGIT